MRLSNFNQSLFSRQRSHGYAALAMVLALGITALLGLLFTFRQGTRSHEAQIRNQVKIDHRQKEDALLRALVAIVPNKAIGAMRQGSAGSPVDYSWNQIFIEAIDAAKADTALDSTVLDSFGIVGVINANTGDSGALNPGDFVSPIAGTGALVGEGITANAGLLGSSVNGDLPPFLIFSGTSTAGLAAPIISKEKNYASPTVALFPEYNVIPYPDIRFGFVNQSGNFIAKRNWWAFSLTFGNGMAISNNTGDAASVIPMVTKNYVLSIYEVPSQLAISAGAKLNLEGGAWASATVDGGVFGAEVEASGLALGGASSSISARRDINLGSGATLASAADKVVSGFDALGARESRWASSGSDFYGASIAGNSGKVAILPLSQGAAFLRRTAPVTTSLSPTGWDTYALGARQCAMQIEILRNQPGFANKPIAVKFHYKDTTGADASVTFTQGAVGLTWEGTATPGAAVWENHERDRFLWDHDNDDSNFDNDIDAGLPNAGDPATPRTTSVIPFYWENLGLASNPALAIKVDRIPEFLDELGRRGHTAAAGPSANNSLSVWSNPLDPTVNIPTLPSVSSEMGVVIRSAEQLALCDADGSGGIRFPIAGFTKGFSMVTDHRVYLVGVINNQSMAPPAGSGAPAPYFPPVSIFAAEKRFGTATASTGNVTVIGQLTSLQEDDGTTVNPLSLKLGTGTAEVSSGSITANLSQIVSPAQLPPVNKMSWLVVIEEIKSL